MTDSDSDYDFESADEGEKISPRAKEKHHLPKDTEQLVSESTLPSSENREGGDHVVSTIACDTTKESESKALECSVDSDDVKGAVSVESEVVLLAEEQKNEPLAESHSDKNSDSVNKVEFDTLVDSEKEVTDVTGIDNVKEIADKELSGGDTRTCRQANEKSNLEFASVLDKMSLSDSTNSNQSSGWGWGSWGMSVLSTATSSVSTFTSQVGEGLTTVLEGVESTFGAPSPEELAKAEADRIKLAACSNEKPSVEEEKVEDENQPLFMGLITGVSGVIEKTSTKVLNSSLDTLEFLGKKTMDVLQENDPGLKKKRSLFQGSKPNLSEALREAKQKAENEDNDSTLDVEESKIHYAKLFDDFQGLVHLEALEMLSKQCEARLPSLMSTVADNTSSMADQLAAVASFCELEEFDDESDDDDDDDDYNFTELLNNMSSNLPATVNAQKLIQAHEKSRTWLVDSKVEGSEEKLSAKEMHTHAVESLAELTAKGVELFHKTSELILSTNGCEGSRVAELLSSIAKLICKELNIVAAKYGDAINILADTTDSAVPNNSLITEVFLEASNSNFYIRDALKLTSPVLQIVLIETFINSSEKHVR